jgi:hypothetical protein
VYVDEYGDVCLQLWSRGSLAEMEEMHWDEVMYDSGHVRVDEVCYIQS